MLAANFPYTPATALIFGLKESLAMLAEEGLANVFSRHARLAEACRRAVKAMGLKLLAQKYRRILEYPDRRLHARWF